MEVKVSPAKSLRGVVRLPGDKSISHRFAILASLAEGSSKIRNYSTGADCQSTLGAMRDLGVDVSKNGNDVEVQGSGLDGLRAPVGQLKCASASPSVRQICRKNSNAR